MIDLRPTDAEGMFCGLLRTALGVHVSSSVPRDRPESFVRLTRIGGTRINLVQERPLLLIEAWAPTSPAAFDLAAFAWSVLSAHESLGREDSMSAPINFPDPTTSSPRYQFTAQPILNLN